MGLRLVAHYLEPAEALIAFGAVDAAGVPCFLHGLELASIQPDYMLAYGGYRLVVCEEDVTAATLVLAEAKANPLLEGERYASRADIIDRLMSLIVGWAAGGAQMPMRQGAWSAEG